MKLNVIIPSLLLLYLSSTVNSGLVTINNFYTSCTQNCPLGGGLPNLSYGKSVPATFPPSWNCTSMAPSQPYNITVTWFYYTNYVACQHSTVNSTISFGSGYVNTNLDGTAVVVLPGTVTGGQFVGFSVMNVMALPSVNTASCNSQIGMEAHSGTVTLTLSNQEDLSSVTCTGIRTEEYCPGLH